MFVTKIGSIVVVQEGGSAVCSLDNVRRFWLCIRGRKKFVPSVHAGVPGSDRGSHRRGTCQAEGAREEESGRRGRNAAVFPSSCLKKMVSHRRFERIFVGWSSGFFCLFFSFCNPHFRNDLFYKFINFPQYYFHTIICIHFI